MNAVQTLNIAMKYQNYSSIRISVALCAIAIAAAQCSFASEVSLQDEKLLVAFDTNSGALTRLEDKSTHWILERRPELGISFRLHAPLPNRRYNFVLGQKQRVSELTKTFRP